MLCIDVCSGIEYITSLLHTTTSRRGMQNRNDNVQTTPVRRESTTQCKDPDAERSIMGLTLRSSNRLKRVEVRCIFVRTESAKRGGSMFTVQRRASGDEGRNDSTTQSKKALVFEAIVSGGLCRRDLHGVRRYSFFVNTSGL